MAKFAFIVHPERPEARKLARQTSGWLEERGHRVIVPGDGAADSEQIDGSELAISLGGDGTMLRTVGLAWKPGIPVLGVNLGRLGYLTEVEPSGLESALERFLSGDFTVEERMMLEVSWDCPGSDHESHSLFTQYGQSEPGDFLDGTTLLALNEAVLEKTVPGHTIRLAVTIGDRPFATYAADGLLVATPTGSTAYNLSVRGPILSPNLRALVVSAISPHMLFDRPLVLDPSESLHLRVEGERPGVLVVDGRSVTILHGGDTVTCTAADRPVRFVTFGPRDFHSILRDRFKLSDR